MDHTEQLNRLESHVGELTRLVLLLKESAMLDQTVALQNAVTELKSQSGRAQQLISSLPALIAEAVAAAIAKVPTIPPEDAAAIVQSTQEIVSEAFNIKNAVDAQLPPPPPAP